METASRTARPVTMRLVLVTTPRVWHWRMPRLMPAEAPKSSALMIRYLCMVRGRSRSQVEHNEPFVFQDAAEAFTQILVQTDVVIQPPECRPCKDHELGAHSLQAFEFPDGGSIVGWCSPVLPVSF